MENGLSIQLFDQIPAAPRRQLKWRECEVTGILHISIMNLKIEVTTKKSYLPDPDHFFILEAWVKTPMTNWQYLGGGFTSLEDLKESALQAVSKQLRALASHVDALANFEQV